MDDTPTNSSAYPAPQRASHAPKVVELLWDLTLGHCLAAVSPLRIHQQISLLSNATAVFSNGSVIAPAEKGWKQPNLVRQHCYHIVISNDGLTPTQNENETSQKEYAEACIHVCIYVHVYMNISHVCESRCAETCPLIVCPVSAIKDTQTPMIMSSWSPCAE